MRKLILCLAVLSFLFCSLPAHAITVPSVNTLTTPPVASYSNVITHLKVKDLQKKLGRKLTLKERIAFLLLKKQVRKSKAEEKDPGEAPFVAGLLGVGLFIGAFLFSPLIIGSIIAGIVAVITAGPVLKKDPANKKAKTGRLLGWISIALFIALIILALAIISAWTSMWG